MAPSSEWMHETVLEASPVSVALAREFVSGHLLAHRLPHLVEDVRLVASELATNAVAHARTAFVVVLSTAGGDVLLTVRDLSASRPLRHQPHPLDVGGRGLLIVAALSQSWGSSSDGGAGKAVWASFPSAPPVVDLSGAAPPAH